MKKWGLTVDRCPESMPDGRWTLEASNRNGAQLVEPERSCQGGSHFDRNCGE
jgi:hypothetical protein